MKVAKGLLRVYHITHAELTALEPRKLVLSAREILAQHAITLPPAKPGRKKNKERDSGSETKADTPRGVCQLRCRRPPEVRREVGEEEKEEEAHQ